MAIMQEAIPKEDWEKLDQGKRLRKPIKTTRPDPELPKVQGFLRFEEIPLAEFDKLISAVMRRVQNEEGQHFIGYDVVILMKPKRKVGRPPKEEEEIESPPRIIKGWMIEGDYEKLRRNIIH